MALSLPGGTLPTWGGWRFCRVSVAGGTLRLAALGPGPVDSERGPGAESWERGRTNLGRGGRAVLAVVSSPGEQPLCLPLFLLNPS